MYDTILVPLDGSELAKAVMPHVKAMASGHQAEVILFHMLPATGVVPDVAAKEREEAEKHLSGVEEDLRKEGIKARTAIRHGSDAAAEIVDYADVNDVNLIAMSTHGRGGVGRWVFGSVATKVLEGTTKPILLVRAPGAPVATG